MSSRAAMAGLVLVVSLAGGFATGCSSSDSSASGAAATPAVSNPPSLAATAPTRADVEAFVRSAVDFARTHPKEEALAAFTAPGGTWHRGQMYVYAYDFDGNVIAHGGDATLVGRNLKDMTDPNGVKVIQELTKLAGQGQGWLAYTWPNPADGNRQEPKLGYVMKVDDAWWLGSGMYGPTASGSSASS